MKRIFFIIAALTILGNDVYSQDQYHPEYTVKRTTGKILVDGILDELDWAAAAPSGNFKFKANVDSFYVEQTEAKVLWDNEFLYISFKADDRQITAGGPTATLFNSNAGVSGDDAVEFFWIPGTPDTLFYQFEIGSAGTPLTKFTYKRPTPSTTVFINPPYIAQQFQGTVNNNADVDTGYTMEIALRFSDYPHFPVNKPSDLTKIYTDLPRLNPQPGDTWRANFTRVSKSSVPSSTTAYSLWSPNVLTGFISSWFHCPRDFGYLHFSAEPVR